MPILKSGKLLYRRERQNDRRERGYRTSSSVVCTSCMIQLGYGGVQRLGFIEEGYPILLVIVVRQSGVNNIMSSSRLLPASVKPQPQC